MTGFQVDAYHWRAEYADGTHLDEHSVEGGLPFAAIDQGKLLALHLLPNYAGLGHHKLLLHPGQRVVFYRTRTLAVPLDGSPASRTSVTTLGWQATHQGRNIRQLWHFGDDGSIREEGSDGAVQPPAQHPS
jgi:hypothetical protein